jgi:hypothetical protein
MADGCEPPETPARRDFSLHPARHHRGPRITFLTGCNVAKLHFVYNALTFTLKVEVDTLNMTNSIGQSYAAKLDGTDAPYKDDPVISSVSVRRLSKGTFEETENETGRQSALGA